MRQGDGEDPDYTRGRVRTNKQGRRVSKDVRDQVLALGVRCVPCASPPCIPGPLAFSEVSLTHTCLRQIHVHVQVKKKMEPRILKPKGNKVSIHGSNS